MPASQKKATGQRRDREHSRKALPAHFGEIDVTAPFDPQRYFTALRCSGADPYLWRHEKNGLSYCLRWPHGSSERHKRLFYDAHAWSNAKDKNQEITNLFFEEIFRSKSDGDFIHYLGC